MSREYKKTSNYKRQRKNSSEDDHYDKKRKSNPKPVSTLHSNLDFSFLGFKRSLIKIISYSGDRHCLGNNLEDFWIFVHKYEATLRKAGKPILDIQNAPINEINQTFEPPVYSKINCINYTFKLKYIDTYSEDLNEKQLTLTIFEAFLNVVAYYLDFKNKEKFEKLRKLRQAQNDLPVAKYR